MKIGLDLTKLILRKKATGMTTVVFRSDTEHYIRDNHGGELTVGRASIVWWGG